MDNNTNNITEFILERAGDGIGNCVVTCKEGSMSELARKAATICRRRFKPGDVLVMSLLDEDEEGDAGIAFTQDGIYHWGADDSFVFGIKYADIKYVDYNRNGVILKADWDTILPAEVIKSAGILEGIPVAKKVGEALAFGGRSDVRIVPCVGDGIWDDEEEQAYIREMYNFIADIVDEVNACG